MATNPMTTVSSYMTNTMDEMVKLMQHMQDTAKLVAVTPIIITLIIIIYMLFNFGNYKINLILIICIIIFTYIKLGNFNNTVEYALTYMEYSSVECILFVILALIPFSNVNAPRYNNQPRYNQPRINIAK